MKMKGMTVALATVALGAVAAGPAQASDAGLHSTVKKWELKVTPLVVSFKQADTGLATAPNTDTAEAAGGALRKGLRSYKAAIVPIKTETADYALGKKKILTSIREFDIGLVAYETLLKKVNAGASKDSLKKSFVTANKRIDDAAKDEDAGLKLLGFKASSK